MKKFFFVIFSLMLIISCKNSDDNLVLDSECDSVAIVSTKKFKNTKTENYTINKIEISGDCLKIEIAASGCDGKSWKVKLIDSNAIAESLPEQRFLKISMYNPELCLAVFTKSFTVDLRPLRLKNKKVLLNIENWDKAILYEY